MPACPTFDTQRTEHEVSFSQLQFLSAPLTLHDMQSSIEEPHTQPHCDCSAQDPPPANTVLCLDAQLCTAAAICSPHCRYPFGHSCPRLMPRHSIIWNKVLRCTESCSETSGSSPPAGGEESRQWWHREIPKIAAGSHACVVVTPFVTTTHCNTALHCECPDRDELPLQHPS